MKPIIVTSGIDSEYVLGDLSSYLRKRRFKVHEFDFGAYHQDARPALERFSRCNVAYITSAHTNLTCRLARSIAPHLLTKYPSYMSPLEVMSLLRPSRSFYVPHDLLSPFGDSNLDEYRYLDLFDHILAPYPVPELKAKLGQFTQVQNAGWVKARRDRLPSGPAAGNRSLATPRMTLFISNAIHMHTKYGASGIADYFQNVLSPHVRVKLPAWHGVDEIEAALRQRSRAEVVDAQVLSTDLIAQSDIVLCNGASSILAESVLMGVPAICLLDDEAEPMQTKLTKLSSFPQIIFHDFTSRRGVPPELIEQALSQKIEPQLKPFDFELVERLILNPSLAAQP